MSCGKGKKQNKGKLSGGILTSRKIEKEDEKEGTKEGNRLLRLAFKKTGGGKIGKTQSRRGLKEGESIDDRRA